MAFARFGWPGSTFLQRSILRTISAGHRELRIARAFVKLSSILEDGPEASVSLASIGNCEIRMFREPELDFGGVQPLFWLELFDHSTKRSVDGLP